MLNDLQIKSENLTTGYDGKAVAHNINFEVHSGDYLCIVGENGSGKSTLVKTLLGLNKAISGSVIYANDFKKKEIGYLPQQTVVQKDFPATVTEIVISGFQGKAGFRPCYTKEEKSIALSNMKEMGVYDLRDRSYRELSGGQQQRVLLARALCATRKMLLLDEPVAGLDPIVTEEMYQVIKGLNDKGITIIMISHDLGAAVKYASHILHIGHEVIFAKKEDYIKMDNKQVFHVNI